MVHVPKNWILVVWPWKEEHHATSKDAIPVCHARSRSSDVSART